MYHYVAEFCNLAQKAEIISIKTTFEHYCQNFKILRVFKSCSYCYNFGFFGKLRKFEGVPETEAQTEVHQTVSQKATMWGRLCQKLSTLIIIAYN